MSSHGGPRHRAREVALQVLYRFDGMGATPGMSGAITDLPQGIALAKEVQSHFDHFRVDDSLREFAAELVVGTLSRLAELDPMIEKHAAHWKIARMAQLDRSLLRMATYELLTSQSVSPAVVIDEAIELAKQFCTAESAAFANGVLDAIKKELPSR